MTIHTTQIRKTITQVAEAMVAQNIVSADSLPFSTNAPGESQDFHNIVELVEDKLQDYLLELAESAVLANCKVTA